MPTLENPTEWPETAKAALTRKIGPLHVWGWVAIIAGGGAAIYLVKKGTLKLPTSSSTTAAVTNPVSTAVAGGFAGNYGSGGGASSGVSSSPSPTPDQTAAGGVASTPVAGSGNPATTGINDPNAMFGSSNLSNVSAAMLDASVLSAEQAGNSPAQSGAGIQGPVAGAAQQLGYNGVFGSTGPNGLIYNVFKNGVLVGSEPGGPTTDTSALAAKYGVNPNAFGVS
jgi:hypothetical protein